MSQEICGESEIIGVSDWIIRLRNLNGNVNASINSSVRTIKL